MNVLHVSSEVAPFAQSGGLADVVAGLPQAQAAHGVDTAVLVPLYRGVGAKLHAAGIAIEHGASLPVVFGHYHFEAGLQIARVGDVRIAFLDIPALYDRSGSLYGPGGASEFGDNHVRFAALGKAALGASQILFGGPPDVLHVHDWQAGPAAIYARVANLPTVVIATVHNLAYRGIFGKDIMVPLGIPWSLFTVKLAEFYDQVSFLKAGMALADVVTTVSPSYATEIVTPQFGEALDGFLSHDVKRLVGIVNGIDTTAWNPETDAALPARFSRHDLRGKAICRRELAREAGLAIDDHEPLVGVIARMTGQKGLDLVADIVPELASLGARLVVLGAGEPSFESRFQWLAQTFDAHVSTTIGFDVGYARRIYAGSDLFLMPSRFEPCGLGQLYAMRYGTIPVVHAVGGLRDTVTDPGDAALVRGEGTGFQFSPASPTALLGALVRAVRLVRDREALARVRVAAMTRDSSWAASARAYVELYHSALGR